MYNILVLIPVDDEKKAKLEAVAKGCKVTYSEEETVDKETVQEANIIIGSPKVEMVKGSTNLKWLHLNTAGVDQYIKDGILAEDVVLTNSTGAYGLAVSEHMFAMLLEIIKKLHIYRDNQNERIWKSEGRVKTIYN